MRLQFHPDLENCSRCWNFMKVLDWIHQGLWLVVVSLQSVPGMMISTFFFVFSTTIHGAEHAVFLPFLGDLCKVNGDPNHVWSPSSFSGPLKFFSPPKFAGRSGSSTSANSSALAERGQSSVQAAGQGGGAWNWDELNDVGVSRWWNPFSMCKWDSSWKLFMLRWIGSEGQFTEPRLFRHGSAACVAWSCFVAGICWVDGFFPPNQTVNFEYVKWVS